MVRQSFRHMVRQSFRQMVEGGLVQDVSRVEWQGLRVRKNPPRAGRSKEGGGHDGHSTAATARTVVGTLPRGAEDEVAQTNRATCPEWMSRIQQIWESLPSNWIRTPALTREPASGRCRGVEQGSWNRVTARQVLHTPQ